MQKQKEQFETRKDYSILFADIKGFSNLKPFQQKLFMREVLGRIVEVFHKDDNRPEQANTWGDGLVAFFPSHTNAVRCALTLRDTFRHTPWEDIGLPLLKIRISLNAGEVFLGYNPVRNENELIGIEINRAARLEPIVAPNHVYATTDFVRRCKVQNVQFKSLGEAELPKGWGSEEIYVVGWEQEQFDSNLIKSITSTRVEKNRGILLYPPSSKFGQRLLISIDAKSTIAEYCIRSNFWKSKDIVFVESGTLPVFMMIELYRSCDPLICPKLIITNNLACATVTMMADLSTGKSFALYPDDKVTDSVIIGGRILDDYAATIPDDLIELNEIEFWKSNKIIEYFTHKGVNHIIMMVSKLNKNDGPCAASLPMRKFKKLLLRYVFENPKVRLSILGEAEKLTERRGWPADSVDIPEIKFDKYWEPLLKSGRVTIISAISPEMNSAQVELAKREMNTLLKSGASCILLGVSGNTIDLNKN